MKHIVQAENIKAIIGLGNPGPKFAFTPHNIGFLIVDELADRYQGTWEEKRDMFIATIVINQHKLMLIKPQTFMNLSGQILPILNKQGIKQENMFVIHDEIDFPFGKINFKQGGSARGHNGLRSLIAHGGENFVRLRVGVGRPEDREHVGNFVTASFEQSLEQVQELVNQAIDLIIDLF